MNRGITNNAPTKINPLHRPAQRLRMEAESLMRDLAYVLQLTRRVQEQILDEKEEAIRA